MEIWLFIRNSIRPGNQTNLQAHVLFTLAYAAGPPPVQTDLARANHQPLSNMGGFDVQCSRRRTAEAFSITTEMAAADGTLIGCRSFLVSPEAFTIHFRQ